MSANAFPFGRPADTSSNEPVPLVRLDPDVPPTPLPDSELFIRKAFETDAQLGCELLFRQYFAPLCSHAIRFVYDRQVAEDIVADIFYTFYTKVLYQQVKGSYRAYLYQAVRNRAYNSLRWELGRQERLPDGLDQADTEAAQPDRLMQQDELYWGLEQAVQQLSPQRQRVFLMSRFEGKSYKEIAQAMNLAPKTVENHLLQAIATIRQILRQQNLISWGLILFTALS
ncbi:sigma-70 family RNA polymerase sigma factor [Spirosoma sp. KUDC1026]|uniref:sigma-70 family RNA polymerase sigma factor n=1 Tax=Spirosoma sp. KUDC1026 TaxID=2745947 RepID=UPI00159BEBAC|nr:sigma-70 family RNA polymerase sigma factor [Spirosoma sp. KUDC1026]QKZ14868.1 sigma-70 family RNA polymerase sigma factor [Spirosoma sp. KUDC1026]